MTPSPTASPGESTAEPPPHEVAPRRATIDVAIQVAGRLLNLGLGVVATALLARTLGEADFGRWTTIFLVVSLSGFFTDLGLRQVAVQRAAAESDEGWLGAFVALRFGLSVPITALAAGIVVLIGDTSDMRVAGAILSLQLLLSGPNALGTIFQLRVRNDVTVALMTANSILWTGAVIVFHNAGAGLVPLAVAFVVISALTAGLQAFLGMRATAVRFAGARRLWRPLMRVGITVSVGTLLIYSYSQIDGLLVYAIKGADDAGVYGAAYRILEQSHFLPLSLVMTLLPMVASAHAIEPARARSLLQLALDYMTMVSLPALAFAIVAADPVVELLYGPGFEGAAGALRVLMGAFVVICLGYAFGAFTIVLGLQRRFVRFALAGLVLNVAANLVLIPPYGFMAAAWVTLATELLVTGLTGHAVLSAIGMRPELNRAARATVAAVITGLAVLGARELGVGVIALLAIAAAVHPAALLAVRALRREDLVALLRRQPTLDGAA